MEKRDAIKEARAIVNERHELKRRGGSWQVEWVDIFEDWCLHLTVDGMGCTASILYPVVGGKPDIQAGIAIYPGYVICVCDHATARRIARAGVKGFNPSTRQHEVISDTAVFFVSTCPEQENLYAVVCDQDVQRIANEKGLLLR